MARTHHARSGRPPRGWRLLITLCVFTTWQPLVSVAEPADSPASAEEYRQGRALFDQSRYADAAACFEKALALAPATSLYAQWLGRACGLEAAHAGLLARVGLARRSREALERAVSLDPANLGARSDLAAFYAAAPGFMGGGLAKARAQVAEIRRRAPTFISRNSWKSAATALGREPSTQWRCVCAPNSTRPGRRSPRWAGNLAPPKLERKPTGQTAPHRSFSVILSEGRNDRGRRTSPRALHPWPGSPTYPP